MNLVKTLQNMSKKKITQEFRDHFLYDIKTTGNITHSMINTLKALNLTYSELGYKAEDSLRRALSKINEKTNGGNLIENSPHFKKAKKKKVRKKGKYIVTSAQNATPIHKIFFNNLIKYSKHIGAELIVVPLRYRNPTSVFQDRKHDEWDAKLTPYLVAQRVSLAENVILLGNIKTQPTAATPLTGMAGFTGIESSIVPHPSIHFETCPVLRSHYPNKYMATTGTCTLDNFTDSKAGAKGEFHSVLGAVYVDDTNDIRQITADDNGNFYDLELKVSDGNVSTSTERALGLVLGDLHFGSEKKDSISKSMAHIRSYKPQSVCLHDVFDGYSINHHEKNSPFTLMEKEKRGQLSLEGELDYAVEALDNLTQEFRKDTEFVLVYSNHDDFLDRYLDSNDWRKNPNKSIYLELAYKKSKGLFPKGTFAGFVEEFFKRDGFVYLDENDSYRIGEFEWWFART